MSLKLKVMDGLLGIRRCFRPQCDGYPWNTAELRMVFLLTCQSICTTIDRQHAIVSSE
jgi:hypothetical protein